MILLVDSQGMEERVTAGQLVQRLHPQADPSEILFQLARTCDAVAKLKDGRTVAVQCRPNTPEPEQQILPLPEDTYEVPVCLHFRVTGIYRTRAANREHARGRTERWLKQISEYLQLSTAEEEDVQISVPKMDIYETGLEEWVIDPPQPVILLEHKP